MRRPIDEAVLPISSDDSPSSRKRRRTIVDAFQTITISEEDAPTTMISGRRDMTTGGHGREAHNECMMDADDDDDSILEASEDERPLSAKERAEREMMRALVFGERPPQQQQQQQQHLKHPQQDPVERKLQDLIRGSLQQAVRPLDPHQCDMDIETCYNRPSPSMQVGTVGRRPRSNSLPNELQSSEDMDMGC